MIISRPLVSKALTATLMAGTCHLSALLIPQNSWAKPETDIQFAGVPAKAQRVELKIRDPEMMRELKRYGGHFSYDIAFGRLQEAQFQKLKAYFKKTEPISYNAQTSYKLIDFLPAKMQALMHKRLEMTKRTSEELNEIDLFYKNYGEILGTINCWGTAWELTRDPSVQTPLYAFMGSRRFVQKVIQSSTTLVKAQDARYGDLILLLTKADGEQKLQHAAIYLGYGYYFERTDSSSAMFFRIVHLDDMRERLRSVFKDATDSADRPVKVGFELRRFPTPPAVPGHVFSAANTTEVGEREYANALPRSEDKSKVTLFSDDRMGGGNEVLLMDMVEYKFRLNPQTGRGEIDPISPGVARFRSAD